MGVAERRINIRKNSRNPMRNQKNIVPLQSILLENIFCKVFKMLLPLLVREDEERFLVFLVFLLFILYSLFFILANIGTRKLGVSLNLLKVYHLHKSSG